VANRLAKETSPYLLQHAENPVDWYPWGEEALARARREDKPILLSIGYSACHWCHVMERESFEDPDTAALMNEGFVNIKVDREERPDLDSIYMQAVQAAMGQGGWPLTAFLTPEGRFFYGGTYFPPEPRHGMPSFRQLLGAMLDAYRNRREEIEEGSHRLLRLLSSGLAASEPEEGSGASAHRRKEVELEAEGPDLLNDAYRFLARRFDPVHGGFGPAPKFPQPTTLELLLRHFHGTGSEEALDMVLQTLREMARGGMRDHLGGGFHRYSVDARWLAPHFEKMLYDNGLLARVYLHAFQITGDAEFRDVATSTLDYILEDLTDPKGGFYSARDADSEGEEGLFYLWQPEQVLKVLGQEEGGLFNRIYDVTGIGNFEGQNILHLSAGLEALANAESLSVEELGTRLAQSREALKDARTRREPPFRDEKVLVGWNSFALRALAEAGATLQRTDYLDAARGNATFLLGSLRDDGRLRRSWKDGIARVPAFLEDYAGLGNALLTLYEATLEPEWLGETRTLTDQVMELFWEDDEGVFYDSPKDGETLVMRPRDVMDNATPSGNSLATELLFRGSLVFGEERFREAAVRTLVSEIKAMRSYPSAFGRLLSVLTGMLSPPVEVTLLGKPADPELMKMLAAAHAPFIPSRVVVGGDPNTLPPLPLAEGREARGGEATAYVCRAFACTAPLLTHQSVAEELAKETRSPRG
jgi:uncharacterized protein YyaL (SSP411 family)